MFPTCFSHALAGLDAFTIGSGSVGSSSPHSPRLLGWMLLRDDMARSALWVVSPLVSLVFPLVLARACCVRCCLEMTWLRQLFVSFVVSICLPKCCFKRLLGCMLSRDVRARSAFGLLTCFQLSPHLFPRPLAVLDAVAR